MFITGRDFEGAFDSSIWVQRVNEKAGERTLQISLCVGRRSTAVTFHDPRSNREMVTSASRTSVWTRFMDVSAFSLMHHKPAPPQGLHASVADL
jgi:hypothetical protein